ncbi:MAG: hypothetical protein HeimC2_28160 [Candidatus Heimdallarchaeota archaeon LC_2]|nr:MAG: hypothetical protein HeimC2_28160 [Candidatus Heimdallarchaeota archaeon LC_2]
MGETFQDVDLPEHINVDYLKMSDGTELRHLYYHPKNPRGKILMYPGMNTLVLSWIDILNGLHDENFQIDYVESREKHTSKLDKKLKITKERMLLDCAESIEILGLDKSEYTAIGSSLGSTTLIHLLAEKTIEPKNVILVGPAVVLRVPTLFRFLLPITNTWTYNNVAKKIMQKVIIRKYTNEKADPKQKEKYWLALELAEPIRLKKTLKAWNGNTINGDLSKIDGSKTKCHVIGATEDRLHDVGETKGITDQIHNAEYIDLKTNSAAHEQPLIDLLLSLY